VRNSILAKTQYNPKVVSFTGRLEDLGRQRFQWDFFQCFWDSLFVDVPYGIPGNYIDWNRCI